jgi:hypothetical protein
MNVGDRVKWTKISKHRRTVSMSQKQGEIKRISASGYAMVRPDGKARSVKVSLSHLQPIKEKGLVTQFVEAIVENNRTKQGAV